MQTACIDRTWIALNIRPKLGGCVLYAWLRVNVEDITYSCEYDNHVDSWHTARSCSLSWTADLQMTASSRNMKTKTLLSISNVLEKAVDQQLSFGQVFRLLDSVYKKMLPDTPVSYRKIVSSKNSTVFNETSSCGWIIYVDLTANFWQEKSFFSSAIFGIQIQLVDARWC